MEVNIGKIFLGFGLALLGVVIIGFGIWLAGVAFGLPGGTVAAIGLGKALWG